MINQIELKDKFNYDPITGIFTYIKKTSRRVNVGQIAGNANHDGYLRIGLNYKSYQVHRLAWLYMTGNWPKDQIDHINGIRSDNRWENLREATQLENMRNIKKYITNSSGYKGVTFNKSNGKWQVQTKLNNKNIYIGIYETKELASAAYQEFAIKNHGEFYRNTLEKLAA